MKTAEEINLFLWLLLALVLANSPLYFIYWMSGGTFHRSVGLGIVITVSLLFSVPLIVRYFDNIL